MVKVVGVRGRGLEDKDMEELSCGCEERQTGYRHGGTRTDGVRGRVWSTLDHSPRADRVDKIQINDSRPATLAD